MRTSEYKYSQHVSIHILRLALTVVMFLCGVGIGQTEPVKFMHDKLLESEDGYIQLSWNNAGERSVELQQARQPSFAEATTLYQGKNRSIMLSGLPNGTYFFRIRASTDMWSDTVTLQVSHYPIAQALILFVLGVLVFLSAAWVVIRGARDEP